MKNVTLSGMPKRNGIARFVEKNKGKIVEAIAALFILLFLYTAISKSLEIENTVNVIKKTPLISSYAEIVAWAIVLIEYLVSLLLFVPYTRKAGLYCSFGLMTSFTAYIAYMQLFVPKLPCSCGGVISLMTWTQHLLFNLLFILLAIIAILLFRNKRRYDPNEFETTQVVFT